MKISIKNKQEAGAYEHIKLKTKIKTSKSVKKCVF